MTPSMKRPQLSGQMLVLTGTQAGIAAFIGACAAAWMFNRWPALQPGRLPEDKPSFSVAPQITDCKGQTYVLDNKPVFNLDMGWDSANHCIDVHGVSWVATPQVKLDYGSSPRIDGSKSGVVYSDGSWVNVAPNP